MVIRTGLDDMPPLLGAGVRFIVAGAVMAGLVPLLRAREGGERPRSKRGKDPDDAE